VELLLSEAHLTFATLPEASNTHFYWNGPADVTRQKTQHFLLSVLPDRISYRCTDFWVI